MHSRDLKNHTSVTIITLFTFSSKITSGPPLTHTYHLDTCTGGAPNPGPDVAGDDHPPVKRVGHDRRRPRGGGTSDGKPPGRRGEFSQNVSGRTFWPSQSLAPEEPRSPSPPRPSSPPRTDTPVPSPHAPRVVVTVGRWPPTLRTPFTDLVSRVPDFSHCLVDIYSSPSSESPFSVHWVTDYKILHRRTATTLG